MPQVRHKYKTTEECPLHPDKTWQWIPGFAGRFMVSSCGDVRRHISFHRWGEYTYKHPRIQRQVQLKNGYMVIQIQTNKTRSMYYVHRVVLLAFHGEPLSGHEAGHLDGTRAHNHLVNLQWVTRKENAQHKRGHGTLVRGDDHPTTKIPEAEVPIILAALAQGASKRALAARYGVSWSAINLIGNHKRRKGSPVSSHCEEDRS